MKRRPLRVVLLLLLLLVAGGALANVAVAWGFAYCEEFMPQTGGTYFRSHPDEPCWYFALPANGRRDWVVARSRPFADIGDWPYVPGSAPQWSLVTIRPVQVPVDYEQTICFERVNGWPLSSLIARMQLGREMSVQGGIMLRGFDPPQHNACVLPLRPIWPGFAINTVFYAAILWLLFAAPFALRKRRRLKRGLCPMCAYDLRGSKGATCPECGAAVTRTATNV